MKRPSDSSPHGRAPWPEESPRRTTADHTFVCYAHEDVSFVHPLVMHLRTRGISTWLDRDTPPGADWDSTIDAQLRNCRNVLIVLSPAAVASSEVRGELRMALNALKPIIPVLYRSCDIPRQLQNVQYLDFTSTDSHDTLRDALAAALQSGSSESRAPDTPPGALDAGHRRTREELLEDLASEAAGRLEQSLPAAMLNVRKERQPDQVTRRWDLDVRILQQHRTPLGPDTRLVQIFDEDVVGGKLLVLGAPGSGKTTAVLELAQDLIIRARADISQPLPVLCNLSSWRDDGRGLAAWLVDQLKVKYGIRKDHGHAWQNGRLLIPLLDGLDEVAPDLQDACVRAINDYQQECRPRHIVVCCRLAAYENLGTRLQVNEAVCLLPLADHQIREYLFNAESGTLWQDISCEQETMDLARSPLLLRMLTVAYEDTAPDEWRRLASASQRQAHLFDVYIRRVLSERVGTAGLPAGQVVHWLAWLAKRMKERGQPELLLEHLQPTWLESARQRLVYAAAVLLNGTVAMVFAMSLVVWLSDRVPPGPVGRQYVNVAANTWGLAAAQEHDALPLTMIGIVAGVILATRKRIQPVETLVWSWSKGWHGMVSGLRRMSVRGFNRMTYLGSATGLLIAVVALGDVGVEGTRPEHVPFRVAGSVTAAVALLALAVSILLTLRSSVWIGGRSNPGPRGFTADAILSGLALALGAWPIMGLGLAASAGLSLGLIIRLSGASRLLGGSRFAGALVIGLLGGWGTASARVMQTDKAELIDTAGLPMLGGVGAAATAALFLGFAGHMRNRRAGAVQPAAPRATSRPARLLILGSLAAACGFVLGMVRNSSAEIGPGIALMAATLGRGWVAGLTFALLFAAIVGAFGLTMGGILGALFGLLNGLTGPDIERRTAPNQGIRQSARNMSVFALAGALVVGLPYGLMNLVIGVVWTGVAPGSLDWLHLTVMPAVLLGLVGALVPGAACIQHFTLRFVLWSFGLAPLRYARLLNYATDRMVLQRVGGRYRFIHDLLREHFAAKASR